MPCWRTSWRVVQRKSGAHIVGRVRRDREDHQVWRRASVPLSKPMSEHPDSGESEASPAIWRPEGVVPQQSLFQLVVFGVGRFFTSYKIT